jgi:hypothetical protein
MTTIHVQHSRDRGLFPMVKFERLVELARGAS